MFVPHWGMSARAHALMPQWVLPHWGIVWHHHKSFVIEQEDTIVVKFYTLACIQSPGCRTDTKNTRAWPSSEGHRDSNLCMSTTTTLPSQDRWTRTADPSIGDTLVKDDHLVIAMSTILSGMEEEEVKIGLEESGCQQRMPNGGSCKMDNESNSRNPFSNRQRNLQLLRFFFHFSICNF